MIHFKTFERQKKYRIFYANPCLSSYIFHKIAANSTVIVQSAIINTYDLNLRSQVSKFQYFMVTKRSFRTKEV